MNFTWKDIERVVYAFAVWSLGFFFLCAGFATLILAFRA